MKDLNIQNKMLGQVICFGEILWDSLAKGLFIGGAPFNVAYHLQKLGFEANIISAVGNDVLGEESLQRISNVGLDTASIIVHDDLPTGIAKAKLDENGNASYYFPNPSAWDRISIAATVQQQVQCAKAIVFGSLAMRANHNLSVFNHLMDVVGDKVLKVYDVNLRFPDTPKSLVFKLANKADVLKLNDDELYYLCKGKGKAKADLPAAIEVIAELTGIKNICVTLGAKGAVFWKNGELFKAHSVKVKVVDTVGAGDAFLARVCKGLITNEKADSFLDKACKLGAKIAGCEGAQPDY